MSATLYNARILRLATTIPHQARLSDPQATVSKRSPICGSRVTVDVVMDDGGRVAALGQEVRACALGQASAALMGEHALGRTAAELAEAATNSRRPRLGPTWPREAVMPPLNSNRPSLA